MYQKIIIIGLLGGSPEMRFMPDGTAVTNFSVATSESWKDKASGEKKEKTTWFRVNIWGSQAEACNLYLDKGSKVFVEGKLDVDVATGGPKTFTRKDGIVSASFEIKADVVRFLSGKSDSDTQSHGSQTTTQIGEDDIPF